MSHKNILRITTRSEFRQWLEANCLTEEECWLVVKRGKPENDDDLWYLNAVEEALCFGWIDSHNRLVEGRMMQRFSPRKKGSPWTERNKERARRQERLGRMTDAGRRAFPAMGVRSFRIDPDVAAALKAARAWTKFRAFPPLYQRIRAYNVAFYKKRAPQQYHKALAHLIKETRAGRMFGEWNDYGRLDSGCREQEGSR